MFDQILRGIFIGLVSGIIIGILILISDGIFYSKFINNTQMAKKYSKPIYQLLVFALISLFYGAVQGGIYAWLLPVLPAGWFIKGIVFGLISYLIMSRHFVEGFAFMNPQYIPYRLSTYISIEFLVVYIIQGLIISGLY